MGAENLAEQLHAAYPELEAATSVPVPVYLVGGSVRDLLLGRERSDIDLAVVGNPFAVVESLGGTLAGAFDVGGFGTALVDLDGHRIDIAMTRSEFYPHPGALPVVEAITSIEADLVRRDFTVNAMAIPLNEEARLIDPHGGFRDLEDKVLRVLHSESFVDDPTRAIRAARYASRLGFALEPGTAGLLSAVDLSTISKDRRDRELSLLLSEQTGLRGLELLVGWAGLEVREGGIELAKKVEELLSSDPWRGEVEETPALLAAALGPVGGEASLAAEVPERPSQAVELVSRRDPTELVLARALGAEWLDRYMEEWRSVELEIDGTDLLAADIPGGPALGRGLKAALRRKLDGEISGRDEELAAALDAARDG